jgi:hypothetical protein
MWAFVIVEADPVANDMTVMLDRFKPVVMGALLLQGYDHLINHTVVLRAVRRDELLPQSIAAN